MSYDGDFGYVCNNDFGDDEAEVVCGMLGFKGGRIATEDEGEKFHIGDEDELDADKHLDEVDCDGDEANIAMCRHADWGNTDCKLDEIVGVICGTDAIMYILVIKQFYVSNVSYFFIVLKF